MADKKIYRSRKDRMLGGVCGGLAEYFNIDSTIVRLAAVLLLFAEGIGLVLYIVAWIVVPEKSRFRDNNHEDTYNSTSRTIDVEGYSSETEGSDEEEKIGNKKKIKLDHDDKEKTSNKGATISDSENRNDKGQMIIGIILVSLGSIFLIDRAFPFFRWHFFWPLILVGFGIVLLLKGVNSDE
ncbi:MAG: PspC domain-containing protein [Halanaerobiales bacterium]